MTEEVKQDLNNVNISIEQIVAAILNKVGKIELSLQELLIDYSSKNIAVNQDPDSQQIMFELTDMPEEAQTENE
jgi:hypothetical protein